MRTSKITDKPTPRYFEQELFKNFQHSIKFNFKPPPECPGTVFKAQKQLHICTTPRFLLKVLGETFVIENVIAGEVVTGKVLFIIPYKCMILSNEFVRHIHLQIKRQTETPNAFVTYYKNRVNDPVTKDRKWIRVDLLYYTTNIRESDSNTGVMSGSSKMYLF